MTPILDGLQLPQVQEVITYDRRTLPEHKPPGMGGSLLQNLGRSPTAILLWGVATGPAASQFAEKLEKKFTAGKPVRFATDIVAASRISNVVIENLRFQDVAGKLARLPTCSRSWRALSRRSRKLRRRWTQASQTMPNNW